MVDAVSSEPVPGAIVRLDAAGVATLTAEDGTFFLRGLPAGFVEMRVEALGYATLAVTIDPVDAPRPLRLGLVARPVLLDGLDVNVSNTVAVVGRIVDAEDDAPLVGAAVRDMSARRARPALSRSGGRFSVPDVRVGPVLMEFRHLGYVPQVRYLRIPTPTDLEIALEPDPVALARIEAIEAKAEWERRAVASMPVQTLDRTFVASRPWVDTRALLARLGIYMEPCPIDEGLTGCRRVGGELKEVELCIDGRQAFGGMAELDSYQPTDIHLIESFDRGEILRVTTVEYLERMAERERPLPTLCRDPTLK